MKLIGLMPTRNEDWVVGISARVALMWCDELVMLDHRSQDSTRAMTDMIRYEVGDRVTSAIVGGEWDEMRHRQYMLDLARGRGATHIGLIDADEILTGNLLPLIRRYVEALAPGEMLQPPLYNLRGSTHRYHAAGVWGRRYATIAFRDQAQLRWEGDQFHHREPNGVRGFSKPIPQMSGGIMHLWGASERRLKAKHDLYKVTEVIRWPQKSRSEIDRYYHMAWECPGRHETANVPEDWWGPYEDLMLRYLRVDAEPWQEAEVRRLLAPCEPSRFSGLRLWCTSSTL